MSEILAKPNFLDFKVLNEPWNEYKLEDGSILKVKVVVIGVIKESENAFSLQTTNAIGVIPNPKYLGLPSPPLKSGENLSSYIEEDDIKILDHTDYWNEYEIPSENIKLSVKGVLVSVARTNRCDEKGIPIYIANVQTLIKHKKK
ncbi:MAG: hypothetical protein ACUVUF_07370 [Candidatus Bathycorpusculaceae bacterium]